MQNTQLQQGQFQSNSQQIQYIKTTKAGRKILCDTCTKSLAKYTCPQCQIKSCSLSCVNKHKITNDCSSNSNHANQYLQRKKINEITVKKDYQYVKQMLDQTDKVKKTLTGVTTPMQQPKRFYFLRKHAKSQYNTKVYQGPAMFQRHRQNISFYYMKTKTIYWVIELLYFKGNKNYTRHLLQPQPDSKTIQQILPTNFLSPELLLKDINTQKSSQFDIFIQNRDLQAWKEKKQKQTYHAQHQRIIELFKEMKLCEALKNINIYEFPSLILVHKSQRKPFLKWKKIWIQ